MTAAPPLTRSMKSSSSVSRIGLSDTSRPPAGDDVGQQLFGRRVERQLQLDIVRRRWRRRFARGRRSAGSASSCRSATTSSQPWTLNASISRSRPLATRRPFARIATRLQSASASLSTCELKKTVQPRSRRRRMSARTSRRPSGSRPDIGSSRMTRSGSLMSAWAMPTRCSMPLENLRSGSRRSRADAHLVEQRVHAPAPVGGAECRTARRSSEAVPRPSGDRRSRAAPAGSRSAAWPRGRPPAGQGCAPRPRSERRAAAAA